MIEHIKRWLHQRPPVPLYVALLTLGSVSFGMLLQFAYQLLLHGAAALQSALILITLDAGVAIGLLAAWLTWRRP